MNYRYRHRISTAITWAIGIVLVVASIGAGIFVYQLARATLIRQGQHEVVTIATAIQRRLTAEAKTHPGRTPVEDLGDMAAGPRYVLLTTKAGTPIASSGALPPVAPRQGWNQVIGTGWLNGSSAHSVPFVFTKIAVPLGHQVDDLVVVSPLYRTAALLGILRSALLAGGAMLIISGVLAVIIIVKQLTDPLKELENEAQRITQVQPGSKNLLHVSTQFGEIRSLVDSFNRMLTQIFSAQEREREFLSNAAHALRTPIQVLTGYATSLSHWASPADREQAIAAIVRESHAMTTLIDRLFELSRATMFDQCSLRPVSVAQWLHEKFPDFRDVCMHHSLDYIGTGESEGVISCDPLLVEAILRILLENADHYATPDSPITLRLTVGSETITIQVENLGPEISPDDEPHLFERFYRGHQPASSQHVGLGLSIADAMVHAMGAEWHLQSQAGKTIFGVRFIRLHHVSALPSRAASYASSGESPSLP